MSDFGQLIARSDNFRTMVLKVNTISKFVWCLESNDHETSLRGVMGVHALVYHSKVYSCVKDRTHRFPRGFA